MAVADRLLAIGASWGGVSALAHVLAELPAHFTAPVVVVQHQRMDMEDRLAAVLRRHSARPVITPEHGERLQPGVVYVAPAGFHTLVDAPANLVFALHAPVHYSRPAIDELFISAADVFGERLVAVLLTGANEDGAAGLLHARRRGAVTVVQDPATAEAPVMPQAAIDAGAATHVVALQNIAEFVGNL